MPIQGLRVSRAPFGTLPGGATVEAFTLMNAHGIELRTITYGGIIASLRTPDRLGKRADIVLGFDSLTGYLPNPQYLGAIVGRYANRIARGRFTLDGADYQLTTNIGAHHLHGGVRGFDQVVWHGEPFQKDSEVGVILAHTSPDGDEGYPGAMMARVTYTLTDRDELAVDYRATTDRATPVNLTQHGYFNLSGDRSRDVFDHVLTIAADRYTPVDATLIPTGAILPVAGTPLDFRTPRTIGARNDDARGYDHNFVLNRDGEGLVHAARLVDPASGRTLDISTTEPGIQFYTGHRCGVALETQHFPDSPNQPGFPSTILRPGEEYRSRTVFRFGVTARESPL
jgi:aldose 1-epimerase